jgi:hypothetical protein
MAKAEKSTAVTTEKEKTLQEILNEMSHGERLEWLDIHAFRVREELYHANLTQEELDEVKDFVTAQSIKLQELEDRKKSFMDELNAELKPLKEKLEIAVREARLNERDAVGKVWYVPVHEENVTYKVAEGNLIVGTRPMTKEERDGNLFKA